MKADVKPNIQIMSIYGKIKFWSFLVIGIICIIAGGYLFPFGPDKRPWAEFLLLIGCGQLLIFAVLFYLRYRRKKREQPAPKL
jgi:hypothetical protein